MKSKEVSMICGVNKNPLTIFVNNYIIYVVYGGRFVFLEDKGIFKMEFHQLIS